MMTEMGKGTVLDNSEVDTEHDGLMDAGEAIAADLTAGCARRKPHRNKGIATGEGMGVITSLGPDTEAGLCMDKDGVGKGGRLGRAV